MITCRLIVKNEYGVGEGKNDTHYLEIKLPALPFIGMHLSVDLSPLEERVKNNLEIAKRFFSNNPKECNYFNFRELVISEKEDITNDHLQYLSFADACWVSNVFMRANCDYIYVELAID